MGGIIHGTSHHVGAEEPACIILNLLAIWRTGNKQTNFRGIQD